MDNLQNDNYEYRHIRYLKKSITVYNQEQTVTHTSELHFHDAHELMLITQGRYKIYAPQKLYEGEGPCIVFFKYGTYHGCVRMDCETIPYKCYVINYTQREFEKIPSYMLNVGHEFDKDVLIMHIDEATAAFLGQICHEMCKLYSQYRMSDRILPDVYGYFIVMLNNVADIIKRGNVLSFETGKDDEYYIYKVIKMVLEAVERGEDVSVSAIAEQFFVSSSKLSKDFQKIVGITLKRLIDKLRLERIKNMLHDGMENKEIVQKCGFSNDSYFIQFFNKHMNMSPGAYRQKWQAEKGN